MNTYEHLNDLYILVLALSYVLCALLQALFNPLSYYSLRTADFFVPTLSRTV